MHYCPFMNRSFTNDESYHNPEIIDMLNRDTISIKVHSSGAYVGRITVTYTFGDKPYSQDTTITAAATKTIQIPTSSTNVIVKAEAEVWWPPPVWSDIFLDRLGSPTSDICYEIWGTTLNTGWKKAQC